METVTIYIDTNTGTWGDASGIRTITVEAGAELAMLQDTLDEMSDSGINAYGLEHGA